MSQPEEAVPTAAPLRPAMWLIPLALATLWWLLAMMIHGPARGIRRGLSTH